MKVYKNLTRVKGGRLLSLYNSSLGFLKIGEIMKRTKENGERIHFSGVLGAGQRAIAELLLRRGYRCSGSDIRCDGAGELIALGLEFYNEQAPENLHGVGLLVYTLALSEENPEYSFAKKNAVPVISRAELAAFLLSEAEHSVAVAGSHGKSTVTAMLAHILEDFSGGASALSGAELGDGFYSKLGRSGIFVAEACEYKDSFLKMKPEIAIVNNIELDHTDYFSGIDALEKSFVKFASGAKRLAIVNIDDPRTRKIIPKITSSVLSFGTAGDADYRITNIAIGQSEYIFSLDARGESLGEYKLKIPGVFNVGNAVAAIAAAFEMGVDLELIRRGVLSFRGVPRRLQYIGEYKCRSVFYDYAHHPTEIYNGIAALRALGCESLTVVFKAHTYSRTRDLYDGFVRALATADYVVIGDIYAARELNTDGISAESLANHIGERALYTPDSQITNALDNFTRGAIVIMGAADMTEILKRINPKKVKDAEKWKTY